MTAYLNYRFQRFSGGFKESVREIGFSDIFGAGGL